jgi:Holliday junction resolvasome RuvABC endonuclease subunit
VLGVDASLASTGYAYFQNGRLVSGRITTEKLRGPHRLFYVRLQLAKVLDTVKPTLVSYEDYAMGARGNNMFHIGELGGVLKTLVWERGIDCLEIAPTMMKSIIALSGRADKQQVSTALKVRYDLSVAQHDEADATGLLLVGEMRCGIRRVDAKSGKIDRSEVSMQLPITKGKLHLISNPR